MPFIPKEARMAMKSGYARAARSRTCARHGRVEPDVHILHLRHVEVVVASADLWTSGPLSSTVSNEMHPFTLGDGGRPVDDFESRAVKPRSARRRVRSRRAACRPPRRGSSRRRRAPPVGRRPAARARGRPRPATTNGRKKKPQPRRRGGAPAPAPRDVARLLANAPAWPVRVAAVARIARRRGRLGARREAELACAPALW